MASIAITDATQLQASEYELRSDPANAGQYLLTRLSDGLVRTVASGDTVDGFKINASGLAGDDHFLEPWEAGQKTLKDAVNEAMRDWVTYVDNTFYIIGTVAGPHPYPAMVRDFQAIIGRESKQQMTEMTGRLPDALVACVGGGSNAIGLFYPFIDDREVLMYGVEAAGDGIETAVAEHHGRRYVHMQEKMASLTGGLGLPPGIAVVLLMMLRPEGLVTPSMRWMRSPRRSAR